MVHRERPLQSPLITVLVGYLMALDPERGTLVWSQPMPAPPYRVVAVDRLVFVATRAEPSCVLLFDLHTGTPRGEVEAGFKIRTALVHRDRVYFGGATGMLALRADGTVLFHAAPEVMEKGWVSGSVDLVMKDGASRDLWRQPRIQEAVGDAADGLIVLCEAAAQPDFDS